MGTIKQTGRVAGPRPDRHPYPTTGTTSYTTFKKYLASCGYEVVSLGQQNSLGWTKFDVISKKTGKNAGSRWIRPVSGGGFSVVSADPAAAT